MVYEKVSELTRVFRVNLHPKAARFPVLVHLVFQFQNVSGFRPVFRPSLHDGVSDRVSELLVLLDVLGCRLRDDPKEYALPFEFSCDGCSALRLGAYATEDCERLESLSRSQ